VIFLALSLVVVLFFGQRMMLGYPARPAGLVILTAGDAAFLDAAGRCLVPQRFGPLTRAGADVELPAYADRYLQSLPDKQRRLLRGLFLLFEQGTVLFPARGVGGFRRFSSLDAEQQTEVLENWATSSLYLRRSLLAALKAVVVMGVVGHEENLHGLGLTPFEIESPVIESDLLYPEIGASRDSIELGEDDLTAIRNTAPLDEARRTR
jgi:hypothetical protein